MAQLPCQHPCATKHFDSFFQCWGTHTHTNTHTHTHTRIHTHNYTYTHMHTCNMHTRNTHTHTHAHTHTHTHIYIHTYTQMHAHAHNTQHPVCLSRRESFIRAWHDALMLAWHDSLILFHVCAEGTRARLDYHRFQANFLFEKATVWKYFTKRQGNREIAAGWAVGVWAPRASWQTRASWQIAQSRAVLEPTPDAHRLPLLSHILRSQLGTSWDTIVGGSRAFSNRQPQYPPSVMTWIFTRAWHDNFMFAWHYLFMLAWHT